MKEKERVLPLPSGASLVLYKRPLVMGILNTTPDSFYPGSRVSGLGQALRAGLRMAAEGADILDLGGESTRPGSDYVDEDEEVSRILPLVKALRKETRIPISIDTRKASVARRALEEGADIINDISALRDDPSIIKVITEFRAPVILMHMRGTPKTMQEDPHYIEPVREIKEELLIYVKKAEAAGVPRDQIILDPGIGFGKRLSDNLLVLKHLSEFVNSGYPVCVGLSRKSFIGTLTGKPVEDRLAGSLGAAASSVFRGASILRVHDVAETADMVTLISAIDKAV